MTRLALCLSVLAVASTALGRSENKARHHEVAANRRNPGQHDWRLTRRVDNAPFTEFETGLGACGNTNSDSDYIVALNSATFDSGNYCGQTITITANGKTATATIEDRCGTCAENGVDLTPSLFEVFADLGTGEFYGTWVIGDVQTTSSSQISTYTPPSSTSTWFSTTSSSWSTSWSTSFSTSSSTSASSSTTSTSSPVSTTTIVSTGPQGVIDLFDYGIMQLGSLVAQAASGNANVGQSA